MLKIFSNPLYTTNLRHYAKAAVKTKRTTATNKTVNAPALVECKRSHLNLYESLEEHCKFGTVPLASSGWLHKKSKGDWFHIKATESVEGANKEMQNLNQFLQEANLSFDNILIENLHTEFQIDSVTSIQRQGWPIISENHHTLIAAETGCGKTICYLMPIIQKIIECKPQVSEKRKLNSPLALILTPGRELASQVSAVIEKLTKKTDIKVKTILGGNTKQLMLNPDFEEVDILVATMGAISKLVTTGVYRMHYVNHVVLDEADTLLDDSFSDKLVYFLKRFPFYKNLSQNNSAVHSQLILASATLPTNISELLYKVVDTETIHEVVSPSLHRIMPHVEQRFIRVNKSDRPAHLLGLVKKQLSVRHPMIIFSNKTPTCDYVSIFLNNNGVKCLNLNGDMLMKIRLGRFEQFQTGECDVLSTTDVGSRGLDTIRARHVINYDFPLHMSDFIHRSGRIGRVGIMEKCVATNFISSRSEINLVQQIEHASRCGGLLPKVNANIKGIINKKIMKNAMLDEGEENLEVF